MTHMVFSRLGRFLDAACVALGVVTATTLIARLADLDQRWIVVSLVLVGPLSLLTALCAVVLSARHKWRVSAAVGLIAVVGISTQVTAPGPPIHETNDESITVMTINARLGRADPATIARLVSEYSVDILALQEVTPSFAEGLIRAGISTTLPFSAIALRPKAYGSALWSRTSLYNATEVTGLVYTPIRAETVLDGRRVTVVSLHTVSPVGNDNAAQWGSDLAQTRTLLEDIEGTAIIAGDFNSTHDHAQFRRLVGGRFRDAAQPAWLSRTPTFPSNRRFPPMAQLDHLLVSGDSRAVIDASARVPGSDHLALIGHVAIG